MFIPHHICGFKHRKWNTVKLQLVTRFFYITFSFLVSRGQLTINNIFALRCRQTRKVKNFRILNFVLYFVVFACSGYFLNVIFDVVCIWYMLQPIMFLLVKSTGRQNMSWDIGVKRKPKTLKNHFLRIQAPLNISEKNKIALTCIMAIVNCYYSFCCIVLCMLI